MTLRPAILIERIGPYHKARLSALAAAIDGPVLAIEVCGIDETYAWERQQQSSYQQITLFERMAEAREANNLAGRLAKALAEFGPGVVALPGWSNPAALKALDWVQQSRVPSILMSDSRAEDSPRRALIEAIKRPVVAAAGAGLVAGEAHARYLASLGMARHRIVTGYDVVDNAHFASGANAARAERGSRERLGLPPRYLLAVGRFVAKKNFGALLHAHSRYVVTSPDPLPLVLVGDGPLKAKLAAIAGPDVIFRPFASYDDLPGLYGLATGFVFPSLIDQWGLVVNEAMASGCPVLASSGGGATGELIKDGVNGLVCDPDPGALEAGLHRFAYADRAALATAARTTIAELGPERFAAAFITAAELARNPARRVPIFGRLLTSTVTKLLARRSVSA